MVIDSVAKFNHRKLRSAVRLPVQIFHRLHLLVCFFGRVISTLRLWRCRFSSCSLHTLSKLFHPHQKHIQAFTTRYQNTRFGICFWWRWPVPPRRPTHRSTIFNEFLLIKKWFHLCANTNNTKCIGFNSFNKCPRFSIWIHKHYNRMKCSFVTI